MTKKKSLIVALCAIGIMAISAVSVFAATVLPDKPPFMHELTTAEKAKFEEMKAEHDKIVQAALDGDYDTWYGLVSAIKTPDGKTPGILEKINKDNFAEYSKALNLDKQAKDIFTTLGLDKGEGMMGFGEGPRMGRGHGKDKWEDKDEDSDDIESGEDSSAAE